MHFVIMVVKDPSGVWYLPASSNFSTDRW